MSDTNREENERRKAMGLPPVVRSRTKPMSEFSDEEVRGYLQEVRSSGRKLYGDDDAEVEKYVERVKKRVLEDIDRARKESKGRKLKKKDKVDKSDSILVVDEATGEINRVKASDDDQINLKADVRDRLASPTSEKTFRERFPGIYRLTRMFEGKQAEAKKEKGERSEDLRRQVENNEKISATLEALSREQDITVKLLRELLDKIKGGDGQGGAASSRRRGMLGSAVSGPVRDMAQNLLLGGGLLLAGGIISAGSREQSVIGTENSQQAAEVSSEIPANNPNFTPASLTQEELNPIVEDIVGRNRENVEAAVNEASSVAESLGYSEGSPEYERIVNQVREAIATPAPAATPVPSTNETTATPVPSTNETTATPGPAATPASQIDTEGLATRISFSDSDVQTDEPDAIAIEDSDVEIDEPDAIAIEDKEDITPNAAQTRNKESIVSEAVREAETIAKEYENRPDMFSNRNLVIRARTIKFKGDEIEFLKAESITGKVDGQKPMTSGGGLSTPPAIAALNSIGGGGGSAPSGEVSDAAKGLKVAAGVDPRIKEGIATKVKEVENKSGEDLIVTSGFRDPSRNARAGGAKNSAHMTGDAVDVQFKGGVEETVNLVRKASESGVGGIGVYRPGFVHLDTGAKRVWGPDYTAGSIPEWAKGALQEHATGKTGQDASPAGGEEAAATPVSAAAADTPGPTGGGSEGPTATPESPAATTGMQVAEASVGNEIAARTPEPPSVTQIDATGGGGAPSPTPGPTYSQSVDDPGNVEPADAAERYAKLFNMAA